MTMPATATPTASSAQQQHTVVRVPTDGDDEVGIVGLDPQDVVAGRVDVDRFDRRSRRRRRVVAHAVIGFEVDLGSRRVRTASA